MQYSQEHLKTMVYAKFGGQTECIMGKWKIENNAPVLLSNTNLAIDIVSCRLLQQMVKMNMDWNLKKLGIIFPQDYMLSVQNSPKK